MGDMKDMWPVKTRANYPTRLSAGTDGGNKPSQQLVNQDSSGK